MCLVWDFYNDNNKMTPFTKENKAISMVIQFEVKLNTVSCNPTI